MKLYEVLDNPSSFLTKVYGSIDKIANKKNSSLNSDDVQALKASVKSHVGKKGETLTVVMDAINNILQKRMTKAGRYNDYSRAKDALRQSLLKAIGEDMKFNEIFNSKLTEADKQSNGKWHNPPPEGEDHHLTSANAKNMTKKEMEEYDLYLVVDKKSFGFNIGGTFLVMGMKFKPDGGLEVKVPKTQRADGKIYIPSNRSGTKFVLSMGPDTGPSIPVDTHVASSLFNRGINEGKTPALTYTKFFVWKKVLTTKYPGAKIEKQKNPGDTFAIFTATLNGKEVGKFIDTKTEPRGTVK